jgi:hypothetical protein
MITPNSLAEFSCTHCISICAFLVPANLVATSLTLGLSFFQASTRQILGVFLMSSLFALALFLHVGIWLSIGVIMPPTFILLGLGLTCLVVNYIALTDARKIQQAVQAVRVIVNFV